MNFEFVIAKNNLPSSARLNCAALSHAAKARRVGGGVLKNEIMTKTKQATDKATARPWKVDTQPTARQIKSGRDPRFITISTDFPESLCNGARSIALMTGHKLEDDNVRIANLANAALIVQAVNEHAALVAVAEWAQELENEFEVASPSMNVLHYRSTILARKLANLATVRQQNKPVTA